MAKVYFYQKQLEKSHCRKIERGQMQRSTMICLQRSVFISKTENHGTKLCKTGLNTTFLCSVFVSIGDKHGVLLVSKSTIKTPQWRHWRHDVILVYLSSTLLPVQLFFRVRAFFTRWFFCVFVCFSGSLLFGKVKRLGRFWFFCIFSYLS